MSQPIPARTFALIYLAMIPVYGGIYASLPANFYHSTVGYETSIKRDLQRIEVDIRSAIVSGIRAHYGRDIATAGTASVDAASITVFDFRAKEGGLSFFLGCQEAKENVSFGFPVSLSLDLPVKSASSNGDREFLLLTEPRQVAPFGFKLVDLCPGRSGYHPGAWGADVQGFVILPRAVQRRIQGYLGAQEGFPSSASGNLGRMLYFSAITITTVGYGDIVPITALARTLVASEAILGVVIIGFFLNAVARGARDANPPVSN